MALIDKVLVPIDFQADSKTLLKLAAELCRPLNSRLVFLHVIDQSIIDAVQQLNNKGYKGDFVQGMRKLVQDKERDLDQLASEMRREEIDVEILVRKGDPAEKIVQVARDLSIKLVILGSRSPHDKTSERIGEVTQKVMVGAPCSVLLARPVEDVGTM